MSTLNVTNVNNVTNVQSSGSGFNDVVTFKTSGGTENGRLCRAWVSFTGVTPTILGSFNVSSVSKVTTGQYSVSFTNAMSDTNYCAVTGSRYDNTYTGSQLQEDTRIGTRTASIIYLASYNPPGSIFADGNLHQVSIFR